MSDLIPSDAVRAIQDSTKVDVIELGGEFYVSRLVAIPPPEPMPDTLRVHTLDGVAAFCNSFSGREIAYLHIESANSVRVWGNIEGRHRQRPCFLHATLFQEKSFPFGRSLDQESFLVGVQSAFVNSENRAKFLRVAGNVTEEGSVKASDDGVSQALAVRSGVSLDASLEFQNPVWLAPYRTFPEITQPSSPFIFRAAKGPQLSLHETYETDWQLTAIKAIAEYLSDKIEVAVLR
jgi:hypothetical protein